MQINVKVEGLRELQGALNRAPSLVRKEIGHAMQRSVLLAEGEIKPLTPVLTGTLRRSWHGEVTDGGMRGVVGTNLVYARFINDGVRHDRRVRGGVVRRRKGAAKMAERGVERAVPHIAREFGQAGDRIARGLGG
jgi:hypothetical protein